MKRPRFIAEQARAASGPLGWVVAFIMARETWGQNRRAVEALGVGPEDHVFDIGCGPGRALAMLAAKAPRGRVVGADPSRLMAGLAADRNRELVRSGVVDVAVAGAEDLPFPAGSFDKALGVHVLYFWPDLDAALHEIAGVLRPGGRLVLVFRTNDDTAAVQSFPPEVYRFRSFEEVASAVERAGLRVETRAAGAQPALLAASRP